jgi:two-component system nitrate/nitrite sensor histidine kinase NarX
VEEANHELRSLIAQFRAPLQSQEVVFSVEKLIRKFRQDTGVAVFFQNEWQDDKLSSDMRTDVIRIIQEALANIKKHADANTVRVLIRHQNSHYRIMVEDDGVGFDESEVVVGEPGEHIGREIMMERARRLGSEIKLESEPGEGSVVSLEFDYFQSHEAEPLVATG